MKQVGLNRKITLSIRKRIILVGSESLNCVLLMGHEQSMARRICGTSKFLVWSVRVKDRVTVKVVMMMKKITRMCKVGYN